MKTNTIIITGILSALFIFGCSKNESTDSPFKIITSDDGIELTENNKPVLFYQKKEKLLDGKFARNNYIHPLYSLAGDTLTEDFPEDHLHHRGIFWAWHQIYVGDDHISDSWELKNFIDQINSVKTELTKKTANIFIEASWSSSIFNNSEPYLSENTKITIHKLNDGIRVIDFEIKLSALVDKLKIGGSDNEKGYGGFSVRMKMFDDLKFISKHGQVVPENLQAEAGPWMNFVSDFGNKNNLSGVALYCHPTSPNYPQKWILRQKKSMQNIVFPGRSVVEVPSSKPIILRYRLVIHNNVNSEKLLQLEKEYNAMELNSVL